MPRKRERKPTKLLKEQGSKGKKLKRLKEKDKDLRRNVLRPKKLKLKD